MLLIPALFLAYIIAPVAFQAARERQRRVQVLENMRQLGEALEKHKPALEKVQGDDPNDASVNHPTDDNAELVDEKRSEGE